jgi:hypothetical protein
VQSLLNRIEALAMQPDVPETNFGKLREALQVAEAALSDIGDADREPGDDLAWCERRAAQNLPLIRQALALPAAAPAVPQGEPVAYIETITGRLCAPLDKHRLKFPMCYEPLCKQGTAPAQEPMQSFTVPDDLPGMWEHSDLTGGKTDCAKPAQEVGLTDEEIEDVFEQHKGTAGKELRATIGRAIIAALREKE